MQGQGISIDAPEETTNPSGEALATTRLSPRAVTIYNILYWPYMIVSCAVFFVPALLIFLVTIPFDRHVKLLHRYTTFWGAHYLTWAPFVRVKIEGKERLRRDRSYVYVANHQSMVDILAVFATGLDFKWVSKFENFFVPFIGWNMLLNRYIWLKRGHKPSIIKMYEACDAWIAAGLSVFMFPEGTRSADGKAKQFHAGAFKIAAKNSVPVVPIVIEGTAQILPKARFRITPHPVTIRILEPIDPSIVDHDVDALQALVRARMIEEQNRLRGVDAPPISTPLASHRPERDVANVA